MDDTQNLDVQFGNTRRCRCLVCGNLSNLLFDEEGSRIRVKREQDDEQLVEPEQRPCFECGGSSFRFRPPEEKSLEWEIKVFKSFLQALFKSKKGIARKSQWKFPEEVVPLCDKCEDQISNLVRIQNELKSLEKTLQKAMKHLKEKMNQAEEIFQEEDRKIYKEDERYYWARSEVVAKTVMGVAPSLELIRASYQSGRKTRKSKVDDFDSQQEVDLQVKVKGDPEIHFEGVEDDPGHFAGDLLHHDDDNDFEASASPLSLSQDAIIMAEEDAKRSSKTSTRDSEAISSNDIREGKRVRKTVVYKYDFDDDIISSVGEIDEAETPKRKLKKRKPDDEDFVPEDICEETERKRKKQRWKIDKPLNSEDEDDDIPEDQLEGDGVIIKGRMVKGVRFLQDTCQIRFRRVKFNSIGEKKFRCTICDEIVETQYEVKNHVLESHVSGTGQRAKFLPCPHPGCKFKGKAKSVVDRHFQQRHSEIPWKNPRLEECDICGRSMRLGTVKFHKVTHMSAQEKAEADARGELEDYKKKLAKTCRKYACSDDECESEGVGFKTMERLAKHKLQCHGVHLELPASNSNQDDDVKDKDVHICADCGKQFAKATYLKYHINKIHGELPFACSYCDKRYGLQRYLTAHKVIHTGERPFHCDRCPRQFLTQKKLDEHINLHLNIRPHLCSQCPLAFVNKGQLSKHLKESHAPGAQYPKRRSFIRGPVQSQFTVMSKWSKNVYYGESQVSEKRTRACPHEGCPAAFQYPSQLKRHLSRYHDKKDGSEESQDQHQQKGQQDRGQGHEQIPPLRAATLSAPMSMPSQQQLQSQSQPGNSFDFRQFSS